MLGLVKRLYGGRVSFNDPWLRPVFATLDVADRVVRRARSAPEMPPFSVRIRTNGVPGEFGGRKFVDSAQRLLSRIPDTVRFADVDVLDIGCSCGRLAYALKGRLGTGTYTGFDIDRTTIDWANRHIADADTRYRFVLADVFSDVYNADAGQSAADLRFPFDDGSFDTAVAYSLFTHLLRDEVINYLGQAARCLRPGGTLVFSCFAVTGSLAGTFLEPAVESDDGTIVYSPSSPRKATAFREDDLRAWIRDAGFSDVTFLVGEWRTPQAFGGSDQDLFVCLK